MTWTNHRRAPRYPFSVNIEVTDLKSDIQIFATTSDLALFGCGIDSLTAFPAGTSVKVKLQYRGKEVVAYGRVIYGIPNLGMGIEFTSCDRKDRAILEQWVRQLSEAVAVH